MILFYDIETGIVVGTEDFVNEPSFPSGLSIEEKKAHYLNNGEGYIAIEEELGLDAFMYKVITDKDGKFETLHPREVGENGII